MRISDWSSDVCSSDLYTSVSELKALLGKSSSGPWRLFEPAYGNDLVGIESEDPELLNEGEEIILHPSDIKRADAEFIVACRNILPLLLAAPVAAQPSVAPCKDIGRASCRDRRGQSV